MTLYGCDISNFDSDRGNNPSIVARYRAAGISFLTHKSVETAPGEVFRHTRMGVMLTAARDSGMPFIGAYVVPRSGVPIATQGANHIAFLDEQIPWWRTHPGFFSGVDMEVWPYDPVSATTGNALVDWLRVHGGGKPVVLYASRGQYGFSALRTPRWNASFPLYGQSGDFRDLYARSGGDNGPGWLVYGTPPRMTDIWQYHDNATVCGQYRTDVNAFRGTEADFANMLGITPNQEDDMTPEQTTLFDSLVWRVAALTNDTPIVMGGISKGEQNKLFRGKAVVQGENKSAAWLIDGTAHLRYWIQSPADLATRVAQYGAVIFVHDVTVFGPVSGADCGNV